VAREMERAMASDHAHAEDVKLLRSQSERCRDILKRLTSLSTESESHLARLPLTSLVEEVTAPHRDFGVSIRMQPGETKGPEPVGRRNPGVIYGLGNLVENAVDFARKQVTIEWRWNDEQVAFTIVDDGPGYPPEIVNRIGEPYMSTRHGAERGGGLGLGLFIAKTLLERSGASLSFRNSQKPGEGALVQISWPRAAFLSPALGSDRMFDTV
jgi:two-component system sensor histidine kinase RegB